MMNNNCDDEHDYHPQPGCRPCCSVPHGLRPTLLAAVLTTIAFGSSFGTITSCHYLTPNFTYCFESYSDKPIKNETETTTSCYDYNEDGLGLFSFEGEKIGGGLKSKLNPLPGWFESYNDAYLKGLYRTCHRYRFDQAKSGFWFEVKSYFGPTFSAAAAFSVLGLLCGLAAAVVGWTACCVAFKRWKLRIGVSLVCVAGGAFELLTLLFFASKVCEKGCSLGEGGINAIVTALLFLVSAVLWRLVPPYDAKSLPLQCCCCPQFRSEHAGGVSEVQLQRTFMADGSIVTTQTTTSSTGIKTIVKTTCLPDVRLDAMEGEETNNRLNTDKTNTSSFYEDTMPLLGAKTSSTEPQNDNGTDTTRIRSILSGSNQTA